MWVFAMYHLFFGIFLPVSVVYLLFPRMNPFLVILVVGVQSLSLLLIGWFRRQRTRSLDLVIKDAKEGHHWVTVPSFDCGHFCSVCETGVFAGAQCDCCGVLVDADCVRKADRRLPCKPLSVPPRPAKTTANKEGDVVVEEGPIEQEGTEHHWVHGNLAHGCLCVVCDELCGDGPGLMDWRCAWCHATVHDGPKCKQLYTGFCTFGKVRVPRGIQNWTPVVVIGNKLSGNGEGDVVLQKFRMYLNPCQVIDLAKSSPENSLRWCTLLKGRSCRILIAGGDGTVSWILSTIEKLKLSASPLVEINPLVGILPLGTGNDLSRVLGYGSGHSGDVDVPTALAQVCDARPVKMDRWEVRIEPFSHGFLTYARAAASGSWVADQSNAASGGRRAPFLGGNMIVRHMSNYFSVGVDAAVTYNFHKRRSELPQALSSRLVNKLLFFNYGMRDVLEHVCASLDTALELYMDGVRQQLPYLEGILILNIPCWGAGVRPWTLGGQPEQYETQRIDDGKLEVMGLYSSLHIAQMQVGLSEPYRFGQASQVTLVLRRASLPAQVDGEPWKQHDPCRITITRSGQAVMLAASADAESDEGIGL